MAPHSDKEESGTHGGQSRGSQDTDERSPLVSAEGRENSSRGGGSEQAHGPSSSRNGYPQGYGSFGVADYGASVRDQDNGSLDDSSSRLDQVMGDLVSDGLLGHRNKGSPTHQLAQEHGIKHSRLMYVSRIDAPD